MRGPVFVDEKSAGSQQRRASVAPPAGSVVEKREGAVSVVTQPTALGVAPEVGEFDVFQYLNDPESMDLRDPVLQRMTVVRYDGEVNEQGFFHGKGTLVSTLGYTYTGDLDRGLMHGNGTITWNHGITYSGGVKNNVPHGKGKYEWASGDWYEGDVQDAVRHGKGTFFYSALKSTYTGDWVRGMRQGRGELQYSEKAKYVGEWVRDKKEGKGLMIYETGDRYEGEWRADKRHGYGVMVWTVKGNVVEVYKGHWRDGSEDGSGYSMYIRLPANFPANTFPPAAAEGSLGDVVPPKDSAVNTYRGNYRDGVREGFGTFIYDDGSRYDGWWHEHQKHGEGKYTTANGVVTIEKYECGSPVAKVPTPPPSTVGDGAPAASAVLPPAAATSAVEESPLSVEAAAVPLYIRDVLGASENNVPEAVVAVQSMLLRHNGLLRRVFTTYCNMADGVAVLSTPPSWRRDRAQGTMTLIQFLRCLSDARLLNGSLTIAEVDRILTNLTDRNAPTTSNPSTAATSVSAEGGAASKDAAQTTFLLRKLDKPWAEYRKQLHTFVGELNFRDFTEALVRIAAFAYNDDVFGALAHRVLIVVEDHIGPTLMPNSACFPICASTRANRESVIKHEGLLRRLFLYYSRSTAMGRDNFAAPPPAVAATVKGSSAAANDATAAVAQDSVAGVVMKVRQCLLLLKEAGCFSDDRFSIGKALKLLFPYDRHPAFTASVHKKRLLPPFPAAGSPPVVPQPPSRSNVSDCGASNASETASAAASAAAVLALNAPVGLSEAAFRNRWLLKQRSRGLGNTNQHSSIQPELELTYMEFIEAVVNAALIKETAAAPADRIRNFITSYLMQLANSKS